MPTEQTENVGKRPRSAKFALTFLAVVSIAVGLFEILTPRYGSDGPGARKRATQAQINYFCQALDLFNVDNGHYPTGTNALQALMTAPIGATNWHQYLDSIPLDQWGHAYVYECPGKHRTNSYDLFSMGPDGKVGGGDDIVNWITMN